MLVSLGIERKDNNIRTPQDEQRTEETSKQGDDYISGTRRGYQMGYTTRHVGMRRRRKRYILTVGK